MGTTPANSLNVTTAGIVKFDGTATFSAVTTTQYDVLVGGASNAISSVGPGTAGQLLVSNGNAANPSYKSLSVVIQTFTSSGTYTITAGMVYCIIEVVGGGGGGGGTPTTTSGQIAVGGGGGAGGYSRITCSAATIGASQTVTIGAAGTSGANASGGTGGTTSVGSTLIQATGGTGGTAGTLGGSGVSANGGSGGIGSVGTYNLTGSAGGPGIGLLISGTGSLTLGGYGGASALGASNLAVFNSLSGGVAGNAGLNYGGGGGGAVSGYSTGSTQSGGAGVKGLVIITEFVIA